MVEPANSEHDSPTTSPIGIETQMANAELEKLQLEIEELKRGRWIRFVPLITAAISVLGFLAGLYYFTSQQSKDRQAREAETRSRELTDYRTAYEELLLFSSNDKMTIARVLSLKQDLDALKNSLYDPEQRVLQEKRLTGSICNLIARDFDFTQPRHVTFDIAALQNWDEYEKGLKDTLNKDGTGKTVNQSIIDKYLQVIRTLEVKNPGVFKDVNLDEGAGDPEILLSEPHRSVIYGFACHINFEGTKEKEADRFEQITQAFKISAVLRKGLPCPPIPAIPVRPAIPATSSLLSPIAPTMLRHRPPIRADRLAVGGIIRLR
jgi:hypothetical protein